MKSGIFSYIAACNKLRASTDLSIMALLAISEIALRRKADGHADNIETRTAYIINQIKRPEEFDLLRKVYGEHYVQISCHADEDIRVSRMINLIVDGHPDEPKSFNWEIKARELIHMDESQENESNGQRVRQVFPLSDVIVNANSSHYAIADIQRFFKALFGDQSVTPTRQEYGMELANTAAQRSSDLSRQVGAAILTRTMEIQALGCNEVARAKGGTYWENDAGDGRDFALGKDSNEQRRKAVLVDLMLRLRKANALIEDLKTQAEIEKFLFDRTDKTIEDSQIMDSLEYGRTVHAEMNAITDAARCGHRIRDCTLYSNTFPCHNCAKHIIASGISTVIFNHPYPKSYAKELFEDSIVINPPSTDREFVSRSKVVFCQFIGIVGPMYARVFTKARWKREQGAIKKFDTLSARYIRRTPLPAYPRTEELLLVELESDLIKAGLLPSES